MARFRVEVSNTTRMIYEVEAEHQSAIHDDFDEFVDVENVGWVLVSESYGEDEITHIRDLS